MRLLELFSGSKSVSKAVGEHFETVVSIDIIDRYTPSVCVDILQWDYTLYPPGHFHTIWASPPCCEFSMLNYTHPEKTPNIELATQIVKKTLEIIEYFNPEQWFLENPQTGTLKSQECMSFFNYYDFDYCRFSNWGYRKRTRIWTDKTLETRLCLGKNNCPNMEGSRHKFALGNGDYQEFWNRGTERQLQRYAIPQALIQYLVL
jgi:site-specific DNA-cytosine methylase